MYKTAKKNLPELYHAITEKSVLYVPVKKAGQTDFARYSETDETDLKTLKTTKSPKDIFFPQSETLYTCVRDGRKIRIRPEELSEENFVVFGMRACDLRGVEVLDRVFLTEPVDSFYAARRERGTIVASACTEPELSCFCGAFGIDCAEPDGADVVIWDIDEDIYWHPVTEKGSALTEIVGDCLESADDVRAEEKKAEIAAAAARIPNMRLSLDGWGRDDDLERFNSPLWEKLYKPCLGCGTCTFVCPTCQCYDIKDYDTGHGILRYRCWDSCMYSDFTLMAHGNNRTSQMQRFRQRFMHKLVYYPTNNDGIFSCTGCGRCVEKCPSNLNMVKVIKAFAKEGA